MSAHRDVIDKHSINAYHTTKKMDGSQKNHNLANNMRIQIRQVRNKQMIIISGSKKDKLELVLFFFVVVEFILLVTAVERYCDQSVLTASVSDTVTYVLYISLDEITSEWKNEATKC